MIAASALGVDQPSRASGPVDILPRQSASSPPNPSR